MFGKSTQKNAEAERKRQDLAEEKFHKARDEWNEDRMKRLGFIYKRQKQEHAIYESWNIWSIEVP